VEKNKEEEGDVDGLPDGLIHSLQDSREIDVEWWIVDDYHVDGQEEEEGYSTYSLHQEDSHLFISDWPS